MIEKFTNGGTKKDWSGNGRPDRWAVQMIDRLCSGAGFYFNRGLRAVLEMYLELAHASGISTWISRRGLNLFKYWNGTCIRCSYIRIWHRHNLESIQGSVQPHCCSLRNRDQIQIKTCLCFIDVISVIASINMPTNLVDFPFFYILFHFSFGIFKVAKSGILQNAAKVWNWR